jgi:hypothetical protein
MQDATLNTTFAVSWKSRHLNIDFGSQPILHRNCVRSVQIPLGNVYLIFRVYLLGGDLFLWT